MLISHIANVLAREDSYWFKWKMRESIQIEVRKPAMTRDHTSSPRSTTNCSCHDQM